MCIMLMPVLVRELQDRLFWIAFLFYLMHGWFFLLLLLLCLLLMAALFEVAAMLLRLLMLATGLLREQKWSSLMQCTENRERL